MVKSFQGVRQVTTVKNESMLITVEDIMTRRLITFNPDHSIEHVVSTLLARNISGGPVVDDDFQLVGMISEGDCLKEVVRGKYNNMPNPSGKVKDYMAREVKTIAPEVNVLEAAKMFLKLKLRRFPVIKDGILVGQISQRDVMQAVQDLKQDTWWQP